MGELAQMIMPELAQYSGDLTAGSVTIVLNGRGISSMNVIIEGHISAMIFQIPIKACAEFSF